ncbi:unnamed protein product [marine sediment metagenome]|uniref:Uncharacterized protein n=1 Tax=marine sediment metagenome TaxID=412755 RepID=X1AXS5_9ZZZZ
MDKLIDRLKMQVALSKSGKVLIDYNETKEFIRLLEQEQTKQIVKIDLDLLDKYNTFLLKNGYCDTDIISEYPTAIDEFVKSNP